MDKLRRLLIPILGVALSVFTVFEVNFSLLTPMSRLALFSMLGMTLCFLMYPLHERWKENKAVRALDLLWVVGVVVCCGYLLWEGKAVTNDRVGRFTSLDHGIAIVATLLVLEATRRSIGWALPILSGLFLLYGLYGASLPDWLFPHRGYSADRLAAQCFLGSTGILGVAMSVMFTYVFLFVVFGAFLEMSGATQFIIDFARRVFGRSPGGPAKVSVLGSGLMGSLSGSAVANAVTTGTFTIPMMRSAGFSPAVAGGITAAAASGGALVPPVMGAGAYMMLEIIDPPVEGFLQIAKAALIPAILYYLSILLIVHYYARRVGTKAIEPTGEETRSLWQYEGLIFGATLGSLIGFLLAGFTAFRAVTYSLEVILLLSIFSPRMKVTKATRWLTLALFGTVTVGVAVVRARNDWGQLVDLTAWGDAAIPAMLLVLLAGLKHGVWRPVILEAFTKAARGGVSLVSASACVGIIIGVVTLTGVGTAFPNAIVPLAKESLLLALIAIMLCSIVLGMGLPSAVCYLLMATLIGPVLSKLGVIPLAAHMFIFYFGMMSMVTPPVALAAYASASIAKSNIMTTSMAAFRFSLVGFTLPFMFVYRPELLMLTDAGENLGWSGVPALGLAVGEAVFGIWALAAGIAGYISGPLSTWNRVALYVAAGLLLLPRISIGGSDVGWLVNLMGVSLFVSVAGFNWRRHRGLANARKGSAT